MSSDLAIRFEDVGKEYRVGAASTGGRYSYQSLGERLAGALRNPLRAAAGALRRPDTDSFWALKGVSFDVPRGEVVGVIGRNGAGKSTLLKILSQITRPSEGQIEVHGRVGSLLEVGTGFHPELTGRENIFLNGAILGMTQREVRAKFDEIVAFSEVERFLDTPVKQYSSGMYTRLAFAVAAHLDPEILVVDEVLAVGDAEFQKKCLGKMQDVASGGRTVLFVSHNMAAVTQLCTRGVFLRDGQVEFAGDIDDAIDKYSAVVNTPTTDTLDYQLTDSIKVTRISVDPPSPTSLNPATIQITLLAESVVSIDSVVALIYSQRQERVAIVDLRPPSPISLQAGMTTDFQASIKSLGLVEGAYSIGLYLRSSCGEGDYLDIRRVDINPAKLESVQATPFLARYRGFAEFELVDRETRIHRNDTHTA